MNRRFLTPLTIAVVSAFALPAVAAAANEPNGQQGMSKARSACSTGPPTAR